MIVLGAGYQCDGCGKKTTGVVAMHLLVQDGRPVGTAFEPQLPDGWEPFVQSAVIARPSQLGKPTPVQVRCTACKLIAAGERAS